ncbi:MAG: methyltransferase domain-containing protein [Methylomarinum sp.]|nr:methyltransferase domain-containing protein [Methylomarinum sp.]
MLGSKKLNLGCGSRFHSDWQNVDFTSSGPRIIAANLTEGIPFPDSSYDVVYQSHLLEHFNKADVPKFLQECFRVMKPGAVIRIAIPDLESIVREYLVALEEARNGMLSAQQNYEWILLEMYDQVTRNHSGGEMAEYLFQKEITNEGFVVARCGAEVRKLIESGRRMPLVTEQKIDNKKSIIRKLMGVLFRPQVLREHILSMLLGTEYKALQVGRFRMSGENHQWMYDGYSLGKILKDLGFKGIVVRSASESYISNWTYYNLDTEPDGSVYKPDSLYIEALKP